MTKRHDIDHGDTKRMRDAHRLRKEILNTTLWHGAAWEKEAIDELVEHRDRLIAAVRTSKSRLGGQDCGTG